MASIRWRVLSVACLAMLIAMIGLGVYHEVQAAQPQERYPRIEFGETVTVKRPTFKQRITALPAVPPAVRIYRVQPKASVNAEMINMVKALQVDRTPDGKALIKKLTQAPEPEIEKDGSFCVVVSDWEIELFTTGQYILRNLTVSRDKQTAQAPGAEETRKCADAFLARTKLLPAGAEFATVREADVSYRANRKNVHSRWAAYRYSFDGIPAIGSFTVEVGPGGKIVSVLNHVRNTSPEGPVPILSPKECLDLLQAGEGHIADAPAWEAVGYVNSIRLVYWQSSLVQDMPFVMPIYELAGQAEAPGKKTVRWRAYVEAVRPEFLRERNGEADQ